jgi:integrase
MMATLPTISKPRKRHRLDPREVHINGKTLWQIDLGSELKDGRRRRLRRTFADHEEALAFAQLKKIEKENHGMAGITMPERLRAEALEADRLLGPYQVSILEVAREYVRRMELVTRSETVGKTFEAFLTAKADDGLRARTLEDFRYRLGRFSGSFGERKIADITASEIDRWLGELHQSPLSRNAFHLRLHTLFEFARQRGWLQVNPLKDVPKAKVTGKPPGILSTSQVARLLESASEETLPIFALGLFAGVRSAELARLEWRHIKWDEHLVEVPALSSKTASRRMVSIPPNLVLWLAPYRGKQGPICPPGYYEQMVEDRRKAAIMEWPNNAMRHSYASYHLAAFKDAPALSLELGHVTPQMVFQHYREVVTPAEAAEFWKIAPLFDAEHKLTMVA